MSTMTYIGALEIIECCTCHMTFAMPRDFKQSKLDMRNGNREERLFFCPAGHSQQYSGKTEAQQLQEQLEARRKDVVWYQDLTDKKNAEIKSQAHKIAAERAAKTKLKKKLDRVKHGVCPCCTRSFQNLAAHMLTTHPEFVESL